MLIVVRLIRPLSHETKTIKETNLPITWHSYIAFRGGSIIPYSLKCTLCIATSLQKVPFEREKENNFTVEKPDKHYVSLVSTVNINSEKSC